MNRLLIGACAIACALSVQSQSHGDVVVANGDGFLIPDDSPAGISSVITITQNEMVSDIQVDLVGLSHSWAGDLVATLTSPSGTKADLFYQIGVGVYGDGSDFSGDYSFADGGADLDATMAGLNGGTAAPSGLYQAATDNGNPVFLTATFAGETTAGDWILNIRDDASADTGSLDSWGLRFTSTRIAAVPEPGHASLLILTGLAVLKRRRRR
ncbi:proprotein convertase P-domain-containing protein [Roseiconus lacunae]|uniref:proprotein convertase P-domain-containing protein n=1 Tax=Roseiconus lacunae TaxID=2605694 RepID=UPI0030873D29|nr:proprotein convertase P-domain-containing protein [Stieleria sp. HD01]